MKRSKSIIISIKNFMYVLLLTLVISSLPLTVFSDDRIIVPHKKNVLIINSYSPNNLAIDAQLSGIIEQLDTDTNIQVEYMDSGTFHSNENDENFYNLLKYKVDKYKNFDLVILADDHAINFGKKYRDSLFKNMPVLFYGANDIENAKEMVKHDLTYGLMETVPIKENLDLINKLHKGKNVIALVYENTSSSKELETFYSYKSTYKDLNFSHISLGDMPISKFKESILKLNNNDVILSLYCHKDDTPGFRDMLNISEFVASINIPKYNTLDFLIDDTYIGGVVLSSSKTGLKVGQLANVLLNEQNLPDKIIFSDDIFENIFNYDNLIKYDIKESSLPSNSIILNKEKSFFEAYKEIIIPASVVIILLLITIIILILNVNKRVIYEKEILKAKEAAENLVKIQSDFICNISHELRTPIAVIMSSNQLLDYKISNNISINDKSNVKIIQQNCYRLLRLVNNIIDVARVDSGFMNLRLSNVEIISLLENLVLSIIPYANNKNIQVIFDTDEEEIYMSVDPDKIERIVLNLLSNAIKFSNNNGLIKARVARINDILSFTIEDNGIGIDKHNIKKIFAKFNQVEDTMVRKNEGSGIGLSLVKSFVKLHNGEIYVDSILGKGSTFTVELPINILEDQSIYTYNDNNTDSDTLSTNIELSDIYL